MKIARRSNLLWQCWETIPPRRMVLIDAVRDQSWTVAELSGKAADFTAKVETFAPGSRVAFRIPNGPEWLALFLALQKAGITAVPLDGGLPKEGCLDIARRLGARSVYLEGEFHSLTRARKDQRRIACMKVTSGTDGLPNAIECRAEHLIADGEQIMATMKIGARDRNLAVIPLGHSYGLGNLVMPLLLKGTSLVCGADYVPRQLLDWMARYRVTVFPGVPALFRVMAALPEGPALTTLRTVISAGAPLSPGVAQAFFQRYGIKIHNFYGSSETGGICYDRTGSLSQTGRSVGRPLKGVTISIYQGRVKVRSRAVAKPGRAWLLNDAGELNGRGELVLLGRNGDGANIGGKKVHPLEVERALRLLPGVSDAVVWAGREQEREFLIAVVETTSPHITVEQALARQLPAWKLPRRLVVLPDLPRTARGKLDVGAVRGLLDLKKG